MNPQITPNSPNLIKTLRIGISVGVLILLTGCFTGHPGIAIVNLETGRQILRAVPGRFNEEPIDVNETAKTFRTLQRSDTNSMVLRTVDFRGKTKTEKALRIFHECLENYGASWTYALSPDGNRIAYLDGKSRQLRMFDFTANQQQILAANIASSPAYIPFIFWLPDGKLLVGSHAPDQAAHDNILLVDPLARATKVVAQPRALESFKNALSHSKHTLACLEPFERSGVGGQFVLYDLGSRSQAGTIKSLSGGWLSQPHWNLRDQYLAYVEGSRQLMLYSTADRTSFVISRVATNELAFLYAFGTRHVLYKSCSPKESILDKPLRIRDAFNGSERGIPGVRINGPVFLAENGSLLIAKVGF